MKKALFVSMLLLAACSAKPDDKAQQAGPGNPAPAEAVPAPPAPTQAAAPIALDAITDADWEKLGYGCSCTFKSAAGQELLIAGGDWNAIYRTAGAAKVCKLTDAQFNHMSERGTRFECEGLALKVAVGKPIDEGEETTTSSATLTLSRDGTTTPIDGQWECGC